MEEVSDPGPEGAQEIINCWRPFNRGESPAAHMHQLYPALVRMPIAMQAEGRGKEYPVSVPAYVCKDELQQVVEDGMLIFSVTSSNRRRWYVYSCYALF